MIPVILAGGSGTRLWPMSRELYPKQLLPLTGEHTMLQQTLRRLSGVPDLGAPLVICNERHRYGIARQLRQIGAGDFEMILEPEGRNTGPAVAVAALKAMSRSPDELILVLPADHLIRDPAVFHEAIRTAAAFARQGYLATFGVIPQSPETGYGYIRKGSALYCQPANTGGRQAYAIAQFVEKPDLRTAEKYLASKEYCWNSGMFLFHAGGVYKELLRFAPGMAAACANALEKGRVQQGAFCLDPVSFARCPSDSIDYAVMEKTEKGVMVPFDAGWSDLGSWTAMWETGTKDENGNVCSGDVLAEETENSLLLAEHRLVASVGIKDAVVVETSDAVLVADRRRAQDVKAIVAGLKAANRKEARSHPSRFLPWGTVTELHEEAECTVRRILLDPGQCFDMKSPMDARLCWSVVSGSGWMEENQQRQPMEQGVCTNIDPGRSIRVQADSRAPLVLMEVCITGIGFISYKTA